MRLMRTTIVLPFLVPAALFAQTAADRAAIQRTALDYIEGWYEGDAARMQRAVHPELTKRPVRHRTKWSHQKRHAQ